MATSSGRTPRPIASGRSGRCATDRAGSSDPDFPGTSQVYEPITALPMETLPDTFVHPAGYCQNVLATGRCSVVESPERAGRETVGSSVVHPRTIELTADRPDFRIDVGGRPR